MAARPKDPPDQRDGASEAQEGTASLGRKARVGIKVMQARQILLQGLQLVVGILLARLLGPAEFGIYAIATFAVGQISSFSNFGIASALVQQREEISHRDLAVAFTAQTGFVLLLGGALFLLAPLLLHVYPQAPPSLIWLVRALLLPLLLSPLRTMASLTLERRLEFPKLAIVDVCETVVFQGVSLACAWSGLGIWSFALAALARALAGTAAVLAVAPWVPRFAWDPAVVRRLITFGSGFQLQQMVNEAGGWLTPLLAGSLLGPAAVGLLTWSSSNGKRPLMLVETVMRVAYPHLSRLQSDPAEAHRILSRYLRWLMVPASAWLVWGVAFAEPLTRIVYTEKWLPGVPLLQLFALGLGFDIVNWVVGVAGNALGMTGRIAWWVTVKSASALLVAIAAMPLLGALAVPAAWVVASIVSGVGILACVSKRLEAPLSPAIWRIFLPAAALAAALAVDQKMEGFRWWTSVAAVAVHLFLNRAFLAEIAVLVSRKGRR